MKPVPPKVRELTMSGVVGLLAGWGILMLPGSRTPAFMPMGMIAVGIFALGRAIYLLRKKDA